VLGGDKRGVATKERRKFSYPTPSTRGSGRRSLMTSGNHLNSISQGYRTIASRVSWAVLAGSVHGVPTG
jgi:hypothetical protein